jgi:outer membrane protein OmpA-like peptidoglycan-associated protein
MEPRFGTSFADVRVHNDARAAASARSIDAHAFTAGPDIVFAEGRYAPGSDQGLRLLAHELTHVVQQGAAGRAWAEGTAVVRRQTCPTRPPGEAAQSTAPGGVLPTDVVFTPSTRQLVVQDFGVNRADLPAGATTDPAFERFMSLAVGDPTTALAVKGYTDYVGNAGENLGLRDQRAGSVIAAFPAALRTHARFSFPTSPTTDFRDTNATADGRARNRAVVVTFASVPPGPARDSCDVPTRASSLDEYMFLVRCAEGRLGLTAATDAPRAVSVLRQLYFGSGTWSVSSNSVWDSVITGRPWSPGTSPEAALGTHLFNALRSSQVVEGRDVGHLLTGLDAMLNPGEVHLALGSRVTLATGLANEEWATWAGDAGSAAAEFAVDTYARTLHGTMADYFNVRFADPDDLMGNLDAWALRAGLTGLASAAQLRAPVTLAAPFSEILMQYFRISSSALARSRTSSVRNFVQAYGGVLSGSTLTNRPVLEAALFPSIENFAGRFALFRMLQRGFLSTPPPSPGPSITVTLPPAITDATRLYVDFLVARL